MTRGPLAAAIAAVGLALSASAAGAQAPAPPPPGPLPPAPPPAPLPPPPPIPPAAKLSVSLAGVQRSAGKAVVLGGRRWQVRGALAPFVEGQGVIVRLYLGRRRMAARRVAVGPMGFSVTFRATRPGRFVVRVTHRATPQLGSVRSAPLHVRVLRASAVPGSRGPVVRMLQTALDRLRYAVPRTGVYDAATARAVLTYRKVNGMPRILTASGSLVRRILAGRGAFGPRYPRAGHHLEADLSRQVLALVDGRRVVRAYMTSSGKPSTPTVQGAFRVYMKTPGTNAKGMLDSSYFIRGYAVHGYASVPVFAASHGCLRIPLADAGTVFNWLHVGDRVFVYG